MIESVESKEKDLQNDKLKLQADIDVLKQEVRAAKQHANEEKSLKLFSES